mmetsp:Transcript_47476/g.76176  ORF Transcript_47476/g.76176 Transcript_47476/m.76176 type:complete len:275 (+) Transcript_47476:142-966(+)
MRVSLCALATLLIALQYEQAAADGHNMTFDTTEMEMETTDMDMDTTYYTSTVDTCSLADITADTNPEDDCDLFSLSRTLDDDDNSMMVLCGYTDTDTDTKYVLITLTIPSEFWFGVGFKTEADAADHSGMYGYAVIIPLCDRDDIQERSLTGQGVGGLGTALTASSIEVFEDSIADGTRTIRLKRLVTDEDASSFDFAAFGSCSASVEVIWARGASTGNQWAEALSAYHSTFRGNMDITLDMYEEEDCDVESAVYSVNGLLALCISALFAKLLC